MRKILNEYIICNCGCGVAFHVSQRWKYRKQRPKYISGHNSLTEEARIKNSEKSKKQWLKPGYREKQSKMRSDGVKMGIYTVPSRKGMASPMKGKHLTQEQKEHLRKINTGKHHSQETKDKCKRIAHEKNYGLWMIGKKHKPESIIKISRSHEGKMPKNIMRPGRFCNVVRGWFLIGDKRMFFRSKWEYNYARWLEWQKTHGQIKDWTYEKEVFIFKEIEFGTRTYRPDFKIINNNDSFEFHEIKGWMTKRSKTQISRMAKYYPDIKLIVIDSTAYKHLIKDIGKLIETV